MSLTKKRGRGPDKKPRKKRRPSSKPHWRQKWREDPPWLTNEAREDDQLYESWIVRLHEDHTTNSRECVLDNGFFVHVVDKEWRIEIDSPLIHSARRIRRRHRLIHKPRILL